MLISTDDEINCLQVIMSHMGACPLRCALYKYIRRDHFVAVWSYMYALYLICALVCIYAHLPDLYKDPIHVPRNRDTPIQYIKHRISLFLEHRATVNWAIWLVGSVVPNIYRLPPHDNCHFLSVVSIATSLATVCSRHLDQWDLLYLDTLRLPRYTEEARSRGLQVV